MMCYYVFLLYVVNFVYTFRVYATLTYILKIVHTMFYTDKKYIAINIISGISYNIKC